MFCQHQALGMMLAPITSLAIVLKAIAEKGGEPAAEAPAGGVEAGQDHVKLGLLGGGLSGAGASSGSGHGAEAPAEEVAPAEEAPAAE